MEREWRKNSIKGQKSGVRPNIRFWTPPPVPSFQLCTCLLFSVRLEHFLGRGLRLGWGQALRLGQARGPSATARTG